MFTLHLVNQTLQIMKTRFLFPYWCRYLGYVLIIAHIPAVFFRNSLGLNNHDPAGNTELFNNHHVFFISTTLAMAIGLFLVAFAKEKLEDEQISQLRLDSLQWAIYLNYILLTVTLIFSSDKEHILLLNLWVPLIFFIIRFRWVIFRLNQSLSREG
jgi:hypothetical protein